MFVASLLSYLTQLVFGFAEFVIGLRIVLKLFGANASAPFVRWVYETSSPLLSPFVGMFPTPALQGGLVIEFSALFAMLVYAFAGYVVTELLNTLERQIEWRHLHEDEARRRGR